MSVGGRRRAQSAGSVPTRLLGENRWPTLVVMAVAAVVGVGGVFIRLTSSDSAPPPEGSAGAQHAEADVLDVAPDFTLTLFDGRRFSLSGHLADDGRPVLLNFWASWCLPCRREMPALDAAAKRHPEVMFLGVAVEDDPVAARQFAEELGVSFPLAVDETNITMAKYLVFGLPSTRVVSRDGKIARSVVGELLPDQIEELLSGLDGAASVSD